MRYLAHFAPEHYLNSFLDSLLVALRRAYPKKPVDFQKDYPLLELVELADALKMDELDSLMNHPGIALGVRGEPEEELEAWEIHECLDEDILLILDNLAKLLQKSRLAVDLRKLGKLLGATEKQIAHAIQKQIRLVSEFRALIAEANTESQEVTSHY